MLQVDPASGLPNGGWTPVRMHVNTTGTALKIGGGTLHSIVINTVGSASNLLTIYDGTDTSGMVIAAIDTTAARGQFVYDVAFQTGLYAVLAAGTAADLTIAWR